MSGQFDSQVSVASKVKVRMVSFGFCEVPNLDSSLHHVGEVFKLDRTAHPFSVFGDVPERSGIPQGLCLFETTSWDTTFARKAFLLTKFLWSCAHRNIEGDC